jgi:hypothetical protein
MTMPALMAAVALALGTHVALAAGSQEGPGSNRTTATAAERTQRICRDRASLRHAPGGVVIGYLFRGDRVIVTVYARRHRWAYGIGARGHGWLLTSALCRRPQLPTDMNFLPALSTG